MNKNILDIYNFLQEIAWHFGNHGFEGDCCEDLSMVEFMALKAAYKNDNFSIQEIGRTIDFTKSGATRIIDRLENKGYIKRERSTIDGRVCCIPVTNKGTEVITRILEKRASDLDEMLNDLEPQIIENIKDALGLLVKRIHRNE